MDDQPVTASNRPTAPQGDGALPHGCDSPLAGPPIAGAAGLRRRGLLLAVALGAAGAPVRARSQGDLSGAPSLQRMLQQFAAGAPVRVGKVRLDVAELVENGNGVPIAVAVDSPMTPSDHVASIAVFTAANPQPEVAEFRLGPRAGVARVGTRIRLATSQTVLAAARMSDGSVWIDTVDVLVALAACIE